MSPPYFLSDIRVLVEKLFILVRVCPNRTRRCCFCIDLERRSDVLSIRVRIETHIVRMIMDGVYLHNPSIR